MPETDFSPTHAALEGFRLIKARPASVAVWCLLHVVFAAAWLSGMGFLMHTAGPLQTVDWTGPRIGMLVGEGVLAFVVVFASWLILTNAVLRAVLHPDRSAFAYMRLGADEGRMLLLWLLLAAAELVWFGAVLLPLFWLTFTHPSAAVFGGLALGYAAFFAFVAFMAVRLAFVGPIIVAEHRFDLRKSWRMTRGRFWPVLGMWLLAFVFAFAISMVASAITTPMSLGWRLALMSDPVKFAQSFSFTGPYAFLMVIQAVISGICGGFQMVVMAAPFARAYRDITATADEEAPAALP